ncbi:hypothetical protein TNCV_3297341 [Trichonephila clavipes]|uniref:Uncharacterized protein n=1 Tax=Trichonephila clavipes TaxID=2585209 RepID=A0A8X6VTD1_TRICX|nr:hypothetical protein TNCV_3297341 [Trichonephila clavipes]
MSLYAVEFGACCVNTETVSAGCERCWSCHLMISHAGSVGDRSGELAGQGNMSTLCRARCVTTAVQCVWDNDESALANVGNCSSDQDSTCRSSVSRPMTVWLLAPNWPSSGHHWQQDRFSLHQKT